MNKKSFFLIISTFILFFSFISGIKADCYQKCFYLRPQKPCSYVDECEDRRSYSCEKVDDSFCDITDGDDGTYTNYTPNVASCGVDSATGEYLLTNIPTLFPKVVSIIYIIIQVVVPVVLVIFGMLDLFKGITAGKEDEIKKGQHIFIKRLIAAAIVFFVFVFVKLLISFVADSNSNRIIDCAECFIKNDCTSQGGIK